MQERVGPEQARGAGLSAQPPSCAVAEAALLLRADDRRSVVDAILRRMEAERVIAPHLWLLEPEGESLQLVGHLGLPGPLRRLHGAVPVASSALAARALAAQGRSTARVGLPVAEAGPGPVHWAVALLGEKGALGVIGWLGAEEEAMPPCLAVWGELFQAALERLFAAEHANHLREKWMAMILHDIRQPISTITGFASLLTADPSLPDAHRSKLQHIRSAAYRLTRLAADLLDASGIEGRTPTLEKKDIDLPGLVSCIAEQVGADAPAQRVVVQSFLPGPQTVHADPVRIEQILLNLIANARKHGKDSADIHVALAKRGDEILVRVRNEGELLPLADQERLFRPFFRGESGKTTPGYGLGLYITRALVEAHGGRIWVESQPGAVTVCWTLPLRPKG